MRAVAHSPSFAKKVGIPQSVGQKFETHKAAGGTVKNAMMKKEVAFMKKKGAPKSMIKHEKAEMKGKGYMSGGAVPAAQAMQRAQRMASETAAGRMAQTPASPSRASAMAPRAAPGVMPGRAFAKGGGVESKGQTQGKAIKMMGGGKC